MLGQLARPPERVRRDDIFRHDIAAWPDPPDQAKFRGNHHLRGDPVWLADGWAMSPPRTKLTYFW